jgi:hypothetical protein
MRTRQTTALTWLFAFPQQATNSDAARETVGKPTGLHAAYLS